MLQLQGRPLLRGRLDVAVRWALQGLALALATRAVVLGDQSPLGVALFAAGLCAGWRASAMLAGVALGCNWLVLGWAAAAPLLGSAVVLTLWQARRFAPARLVLRDSQGEAVFRSQDAVCAALAGVGTLLPALAVAHGLPYNILSALLNGVLALCCAPVLIPALRLTPARHSLTRDEQLSLVVLLLCALLGVARLPLWGGVVARALAGMVTLLAAMRLGAGMGAASGLLLGSALAVAGDELYIGASLGLCGILAGGVRHLGRPASALAFALGNFITLIYGMGYSYGALHPLAALCVGGACCLMPERWLDVCAGWAQPADAGRDPSLMAARMRHAAQKKLRALAAVFDELAQGHAQSEPPPSEQALIAGMRTRLCQGCADYERCWNGSDGHAGRLLCELLCEALLARPLDEDAVLPPEVGRLCRRAAQIPARLGAMLTEFDLQRRTALAKSGASALLERQFRQAARVLAGAGEQMAAPVTPDAALSRQVSALLEREGLPVCEVMALDTGALEITCVLRDGLWTRETAQRAAEILSAELGVPLRPALIGPEQPPEREICFFQAPRYTATVGFASRPAREGQRNGDSHIAAGITGGRVLLALSDGMGSGEAAARESATTVRLLRRFLVAEVENAVALDTVNRLLMLLGGEDMFATVDLCVLDLCEGQAQFTKLGGCASLVLRRGECLRIEGGRLPLGILEDVTPSTRVLRLHPGDLLIMFTDGVADPAREGQTEWMADCVRRLRDLSPQRLCEAVLEAAVERSDANPDDMTILAARIGRP